MAAPPPPPPGRTPEGALAVALRRETAAPGAPPLPLPASSTRLPARRPRCSGSGSSRIQIEGAPRRHLGVQEEEEEDGERSLESKRLRGQRRLLVVLEGASLETVKVGKTFELLNCDKHKALLLRNGRDPGEVRPDITHQSLLMLMDSPLNRAGLLQVYIHTKKNVLIEVNPQTRIPRTFDRFCGLMVQLLHKLSVRAADGPQKLLKVIKNPVSDHLPVGCMKIGTSFAVSQVSDLRELVPAAEPVVIVVGAFAHGSVNVDYTEKMVSISNYPLSAALTCAKITTAFEEVWGVV
ncbi:PREDICTED: ribosomal RNA small subunit methyltransferase NEP1 [Ficedula albicollis]|nr:PREDICTED: ribosomal RNA small subunit methyltransferase NEP1 [Ficedula albicollis]